MNVTMLDWTIIASLLLISFGISLIMSKKAAGSTGDFFLTGRNLPWFIAGTSMVATTFAADTPLAVTELIAQKGIAGNWLWWNMLFGGMLTVFFFARLWRRSNILTDAEFVAIRYSGLQAKILRGLRAVYIGVFMNAVVMAWVNLAMVKILKVMFPRLLIFGLEEISILGVTLSSHLIVVGLLMLFVALYSSISGLWGISITDTFQFILAMTGCIILAIFALNHIGGISGLKTQLSGVGWVLDFIPSFGTTSSGVQTSGLLKLSATGLFAYLGIQWWASWYPGAEPGGGGYVAQRIMSAKNEKHSLLATLWFQIAHYAIRPWPWIIVALVALVLYPTEADKGATFIMVIRDLLPSGLTGMLLAAFLAAYMSTIASHTVWGTSYIINDFFRPFIKPDASEKYYVMVSRITTFIMMILSIVVTTQFNKISDVWKFILACSGGIGLVLILRWFWWRINAWSEISAMIAPYAVYPILKYHFQMDYETSLIIIVVWSTFVWLVVTFLTTPTDEKTLISFFRKVHPGGFGWHRISTKVGNIKGDSGYLRLFINYICGCLLVLFSLFGFGKFIFKEYPVAVLFILIAFICGAIIYRNLSKTGWSEVIN
jgi:Na+/proline symporter